VLVLVVLIWPLLPLLVLLVPVVVIGRPLVLLLLLWVVMH
jgi:hypothetical protein